MDKRAWSYRCYRMAGRYAGWAGGGLSRPIFVLGTGRSGTTLLAGALASNNGIVAFPGEGNALWHPKAYPFSARAIDVEPFLFDPRSFTQQSLTAWPPTHKTHIRRTLSGFMILHGRGRRLLVKSAMASFMVETLLEILPDAIFVHIYRSGPSVVESLVKKEWPKYRELIDQSELRLLCAHYWNACLVEIDRVNRDLQLAQRGQLIEVQYEQFCEDPITVLKDLSRVVGLDETSYAFEPGLVRSRNYKVGDYKSDPDWAAPLAAMQDGARLKGY